MRLDDLTVDMIEALGIDPEGVVGFELEVRLGSLPNLTVYHEAWDEHSEAFARTLTRYELVRKPD